MRKMLIITLVFAILLLSGCSMISLEMGEIPVEPFTGSVPQTEIKGAEKDGVTSTESTTTSDREDNTTLGHEPLEIRDDEHKKETTAKVKLPPQSSCSNNSVVNKDLSTSNNSQSISSSQEIETQTVSTIVRAGKEDSLEVANRVLYYVNEFRDVPATYLPELAEYAQYRSQQLISNFTHDTADQRAAATTLQYGEYIDPSVFGGSGQPYYRANAREAIAKASYVGAVDEVAYKLASLVKNSPNHWNYIGSSEYTYIAVGVTYESDMWYCAIEVACRKRMNSLDIYLIF